MDGKHFDRLVSGLNASQGRRSVLTALGSLVAGVAVAKSGGIAQADSPRSKKMAAGRPCAFNTNCRSEVCCNQVCCAGRQSCDNNGKCVTPGPICSGSCNYLTECGPRCRCSSEYEGTCVEDIAAPICSGSCNYLTECGPGCRCSSEYEGTCVRHSLTT